MTPTKHKQLQQEDVKSNVRRNKIWVFLEMIGDFSLLGRLVEK